MKNFNKKFTWTKSLFPGIKQLASGVNKVKTAGLIVSAFVLLVASGCRKVEKADTPESYYGYGKLIITCESKCHISFGTPDKMNVYDIDASTATYTFRYQTKYNLDITITPTDKDQRVEMSVYSREEKQIFRNSAMRKLNEPWVSKILVP